jgi:hypothetical protein
MNNIKFDFCEFDVYELTKEEIVSINGGESGWYYLGQAYYHVEKGAKNIYNGFAQIYNAYF